MKYLSLFCLLLAVLLSAPLVAQSNSADSGESLSFLEAVENLSDLPGAEMIPISVASLRELARELRRADQSLEVSQAKLESYERILEMLESRLRELEKRLEPWERELQTISKNILTPKIGIEIGPTYNANDGFGIQAALSITF